MLDDQLAKAVLLLASLVKHTSETGVKGLLGHAEVVTFGWLSDDEHDAWFSLAATVELLPSMLDGQLRRDAQLTYFEYLALAVLADAPARTLRMTALASHTNATLARLSNVARRLEGAGLIERFPCPEDRRATNVRLLSAGLRKVEQAAPGHVAIVRSLVLDALTPEQVLQLRAIAGAILSRLDPMGVMAATLRTRPGRDAD